MKNKFRISSILVLFFFQIIAAQDVVLTVQVLPPYSTYLPDYLNNPNRIIFTMIANENASVKLKASITGDNGISVVSSNSNNVPPIKLLANQLKILNGTDLKNYLNISNAIVTGINKNDLYNGSGIPEGVYTICIQALDFTTGTPLSNPEPMGCSNPFEIKQTVPPELIAPSCNETVDAKTPQSLVFSWLPPQGVPINVQYKLKIVELIPKTRNPNEAMNSATTPAFFETTTNSLSFLYTPAQPALKIGNKYAWRVTVISSSAPSASGTQGNFQNNGNSEVCSFEYIKEIQANPVQIEAVASTIKLIYPIQKQKLNNGMGFEFSWKPSTNPKVKEYQVQMTGLLSEKMKINEWSEISDALFEYQYSYGTLNPGLNLTIQMPANYNASNGKNAWRVVGLDENKMVIDASKIEMYEIVELSTTDRILLISPIQRKKIPNGYGLKLEWQSSKKQSVTSYQVQFTDRLSQDVVITEWNQVTDKLFAGDYPYCITTDKTQELFFYIPNQMTTGTGKFAWRVIAKDVNGFLVDQSNIETYELIQDESEIAYMQSFTMANYYIKITKLFDKNPDKFSGTGTTQLWAGGPEVAFSFSNLKVKPYKYSPNAEKNLWMAIDGELNVKVGEILANESWFDLETHVDCDGTFKTKFNVLRLVAKVEGAMDAKNELFKITKDNSFAEAKVIGKWSTNWFKPGNQELYEFNSNETAIKMSFTDGFNGTLNLNPIDLDGLANGEIFVLFSAVGIEGKTDMKIKGFQAETELSGAILVSNSSPSSSNSNKFETLQIPFANQKNLNFPVTFQNSLDWSLVKNGTVRAKVTKAYVHLSDNGVLDVKFSEYPNGLNVDEFLLDFDVTSLNVSGVKTDPKNPLIITNGGNFTQEHMSINLDKMNSKGFGFYSFGSEEMEFNSKTKLSGYDAVLSKSKKLIKENKIKFMIIKGSLYVPFINDWSKLNIEINEDKLVAFGIGFDYTKKYYLSNSNDNQIYITLSNGILKNGLVRISPNLHVKNGKKGFETENFYLCDVFVKPTGAISFNSNSFESNTETVCEGNQKLATYYKFDYPIDKIKLKQKSQKNDVEFVFSGSVILAENITTTTKKESGFVYHGKDPSPESMINADLNSTPTLPNNGGFPKGFKPQGPSFSDENLEYSIENTVEFTDDKKEIQASYEDGAQKFGGGMKLKYDPVWGNYFELDAGYISKQPEYKEFSSKLILGKTKNESKNYSYWFFSFEQIGIAKVQIIPAIIEAHGFGGKAYYHMNVVYDNVGKIKDMNPNKDVFLGIAVVAYLETAADEGRLLHAKATIVTQFKGWSIDAIDYFIDGDAIATSNQENGFMQIRMNGQLNFNEKYLDGTGAIWGGIPDVICIGNENQDNLGFHFGADDFYINVGSIQAPITVTAFCGTKLSMTMGTFLTLSKSSLAFGIVNNYDSGWVGLDLKVASASARLQANLTVNAEVTYYPFQVTGNASFTGTASGQGCVNFVFFEGCIDGSVSVPAPKLSVAMPNPTIISGAVVCDVHKYIPNFTLRASWSSKTGFSISL